MLETRDELSIRVIGGAHVERGVEAAVLARLLLELERSLGRCVRELWGGTLVVTRLDGEAGMIVFGLVDRDKIEHSPTEPFADLVESLASWDPDVASPGWSPWRLAWGLPPGVDALEFRCGQACATLASDSQHQSMHEWDLYLKGMLGALYTSTGPYRPPAADELLDFDAEEFNREVAEAHRADRDWA